MQTSGENSPIQRSPELVEHYFRHEYGRLVALLTRALGVRHLELAEDVVQSSLSKALLVWARSGVPNDPSAWLYRTARNLAMDALRRQSTEQRVFETNAVDIATSSDEAIGGVVFPNEIEDERLRLLFLCCHPTIAMESRIAFALRTVGGFSTSEIASAFLISNANAEKRITRTKERLREDAVELMDLNESILASRVDAVQSTLYLLFSEGYSASGGDVAIRSDICEEAIRMTRMLNANSIIASPSCAALLALMLMHSARFGARLNEEGGHTLLADQDRQVWDWDQIREGMEWMARAANGSELSRYHLEAAIAWEHCRAASFEKINWRRVTELYEQLLEIAPSPMVQLNHAIALSYDRGPVEGIQRLVLFTPQERARIRPWWDCAIADAFARQGKFSEALSHLNDARALAANAAQRLSIERRIRELELARREA